MPERSLEEPFPIGAQYPKLNVKRNYMLSPGNVFTGDSMFNPWEEE
jgi:hypothetical protein